MIKQKKKKLLYNFFLLPNQTTRIVLMDVFPHFVLLTAFRFAERVSFN